jgi:hypothetical protein
MFLLGMIFVFGYLFLNTGLLGVFFANVRFYDISSTLILLVLLPLAYQIGLIINRLGSLLEDALKTEKKDSERGWVSKIFQFSWRKYELYQKAEKVEPFIKALSREYALSRNSLVLFLLLSILGCLYSKSEFAIVMGLISVLFHYSMKKHASKIVSRIDCNTKLKTRK